MDESWVIPECKNQLDGYKAMLKILEKTNLLFLYYVIVIILL